MSQSKDRYGSDASILITGASSGIGSALAEHLAGFGGKLALVARREQQLQQVANKVRARGGRPLVVVGDVTDPASVADAHRQIVAAHGAPTVAFLNAGIGENMPLAKFDASLVKRVFDVNVIGVANWLEVVLPAMLERRAGTVVGISSLAAARGLPNSGPYCASKAALSSLLEALRLEANACGIQISIVEPGFIRSELTARNKFRMPFLMDPEHAVEVICDAVAAGRGWVRFPWQMSTTTRILRHVPSRIYERMAPSLLGKRKKRASSTARRDRNGG